MFEKDEKEIYKQTKSFQVTRPSLLFLRAERFCCASQIDQNFVRIKNIAISPSEEDVVCTLENSQAYVLGLSNTDILKTEVTRSLLLRVELARTHCAMILLCRT